MLLTDHGQAHSFREPSILQTCTNFSYLLLVSWHVIKFIKIHLTRSVIKRSWSSSWQRTSRSLYDAILDALVYWKGAVGEGTPLPILHLFQCLCHLSIVHLAPWPVAPPIRWMEITALVVHLGPLWDSWTGVLQRIATPLCFMLLEISSSVAQLWKLIFVKWMNNLHYS